MKRYRNLSGGSGVVAFEFTAGSIRVRFARSGRIYEYSHASAGPVHVAEMKRLARSGRGLSTYIAQHAPGFVR